MNVNSLSLFWVFFCRLKLFLEQFSVKACVLNSELPQNSRLVSLVPKSKYTTYNMSGRVVSDVQTRAQDDRLYVRYNTDANIVYSTCDTNGCKRSHSSKILEIGMILGEKMLYFDFRCHIVEEFNKGIYDYIIATDENIEHGGSKNSGCILLTNIF